jgi:hypothetical protein
MMSVKYTEGTDIVLLTCPRCNEVVEMNARDVYDWERLYRIPMFGVGVVRTETIGQLLCIPCRREYGVEWTGKYEQMEIDKQNFPAPTPPNVKRECATCEGVFDVPIGTPCATCYGHTNWRPGAKK